MGVISQAQNSRDFAVAKAEMLKSGNPTEVLDVDDSKICCIGAEGGPSDPGRSAEWLVGDLLVPAKFETARSRLY